MININFVIALIIVFLFGIGIFFYGLSIARKLKKESKEKRLIYDIRCQQCGQQLDYYECKDKAGDTVVLVNPHLCQNSKTEKD